MYSLDHVDIAGRS